MIRHNLINLLGNLAVFERTLDSSRVWSPLSEIERRREYRDQILREIGRHDREEDIDKRQEVLEEDPYTIINSRFKCSFDHLFFSKENPCVIGETTKETNTKLEDVDLDEFEKVLNGG